MKQITSLLIFITCLTTFGQKQLPDTLYVNTVSNTYLIFEEGSKIHFADIDVNDPHYTGTANENVFFVRAVIKDAPTRSFMIKVDQTIWTGVIAYKTNITQYTVDLSSQVREEKQQKAQIKNEEEEEDLHQKMNRVFSDNNVVKDVGGYKNSMYVTLDNIYNDSKNAFMAIKIDNKSSVNFEIDYMEIVVMEASGKINSVAKNYEVKIIEFVGSKTIEQKTKRRIGLITPSIAASSKGKVRITFKDKSGSRAITMDIPLKVVMNAKTF